MGMKREGKMEDYKIKDCKILANIISIMNGLNRNGKYNDNKIRI